MLRRSVERREVVHSTVVETHDAEASDARELLDEHRAREDVAREPTIDEARTPADRASRPRKAIAFVAQNRGLLVQPDAGERCCNVRT
eukprot:1982159-Prymnesium_polylepis.2